MMGQRDVERAEREWKRRRKVGNTTIKRFLKCLLPYCCIRFLWSEHRDFWISKLFFGFGVGGFIGMGLYFLLVHPRDLYEDHKMYLLYILVGSCAMGWAISPQFRCATLLIVPQGLGKEGRAYLLVFVVAGIYNGPITNIQHNVEEISKSIGCTIEMQVNHSKKVWKIMIAPFKKMVQDLVRGGKEFVEETKDVQKSFRGINEQLVSEYGYKPQKADDSKKKVSTQKDFEMKTKLRCDSVIEESIERCREWFDIKHDSCMRTIFVPFVNHLLCIPMKFKFLCDIMYIMSGWCKNRIPVEGNFGQTYDKVNDTVDKINKQFYAEMTVKQEEQDMIVGTNISRAGIAEELNLQMEQKKGMMDTAMSVVQVLLSCTFILLFFGAFSYTNQYNKDIRFDNVYITTYFRQIDARRNKLGKRTLLPLKNADKVDFIFPNTLKIHPPEMHSMMKGVMNFLPVVAFLAVSYLIDHLLYLMLSTIRKHSFIQYSFRSSHQLEVIIGGEGMLALLLKKTVGALNTSSSTVLEADNLHCLPEPTVLSRKDYLITSLPVLVILVMCFSQVYVFRLRRVIASFYFPKREKKRVLFLYNEYIRKRITFIEHQRKKIMKRARLGKTFARGVLGNVYQLCVCCRPCIRRRCLVCNNPKNDTSVTCPTEGCNALYCKICWRDMKYFCFACTPYRDFVSDVSDSDDNMKYAD